MALALLEVFVHLPPAMRRKGALPTYVAVALDIPDVHATLARDAVTWGEARSRSFGDGWLASRRDLAIAVPSRVIHLEQNLLVNPSHPDIRMVQVAFSEPFVFDDRLGY